jgi:hypothetical protein
LENLPWQNLINNVSEFFLEFAYIGSEGDIVWRDKWQFSLVPRAVRIHLTVERPEGEIEFTKCIYIYTGEIK